MKVPGENRLIYIGLVLIIVVMVLFGVTKAMTHKLEVQVKDANAKIATLNKDRDKDAEAKLISLNKQTALIDTLLTSHVFWTHALTRFERALEQQMQVKSFDASAQGGVIKISAIAQSYLAIARQIAAFTAGEGINDVSTSGVKSSNDGKYEFSIDIKFDKTKFFSE